MTKELIKILVVALLSVVLFTLITSKCSPEYIEKDTTTEVKIDSTTIDSLSNRITYLESLPPDTVEVEIEIPVPVIEEDSSYTYRFPYADSLLIANWTANTGREVDFNTVHFDYILKRERRVVKEKETITLTEYRTKTITKTLIENPKPYFTFGFEAGTMNNISPTVGFMTKKKYHIRYRYNLEDESHNVGISIPIRF